MNKSELRKLYLLKRKSLGRDETEQLSSAILKRFIMLDFSNINYLHIFYPIAGQSEFNTILLADWLRKEHPHINLVLSKSDTGRHTLSHYLWQEATPLAMNQWGITEPEGGIIVEPSQLNMILVPLLAFDLQGQRVGYGKGFYDRFLAECRPSATRIGISLFPPVDQIDDISEHDTAMDLCITPEKLWNFKLKI